ncbi:MAG: stage II sporulation protein P [Clostridium sp.]|nr:stage II sporulation protein P [Clostridium sp.]MCM1444601.1 stage II sporulation protein P [Candidatus Amulumruptor caecigallinarius]
MNKFRGRRKIKLKFRYIIYILIILLLYYLFIYISKKFSIINVNDNIISKMLSNSNYHFSYDNKYENLFENTLSVFIDVNNPIGILKNQNENKITITDSLKLSDFSNNKKIYIYNTHDKEKYQNSEFGLKVNIYSVSNYMKDKLKEYGYDVILEKSKTSDLIQKRNLKYLDYFITNKEIIMNNTQGLNIDLYIDIHIDDLKYDETNIKINEKTLAKVRFSVGGKNENYRLNYDLATSISEKINKKYNNLSSVSISNSQTYNQDISENMILINIGGYENKLNEVINTIDVITPIIKEVLDEKAKNS